MRLLKLVVCLALMVPTVASADPLTFVSDLISQSAPSATTTHRIRFTVDSAVPPSGRIYVEPELGAYDIPVGFDYLDVDVAVATSTSFYGDRPTAAVADATNDAVVVTPGVNGSLYIVLNSTEGIAAGDRVEIRLGSNATYGGAGDSLVSNPATLGSYRIRLRTTDSIGATIDSGTAMIVMVASVGVHALPETLPPARFNGLPSGTVAAGNPEIEISLNTDEIATCRYATSTGVSYASMTGAFSASSNGQFHHEVIYDHEDDTAYSYYVRCADYYGIFNTDDYEITFTIDAEQTAGAGGSDGSGGSGSVPNGSQVLFQSSVALSGLGPPGGRVFVLKDSVQVQSVQTSGTGSFTANVGGLERGTYTFGLYAVDRDGNRSATHSATLTLGQGTTNSIANIILPPTVALESDTAPIGEPVRVFGHTIPGREVELIAIPDSGILGGSLQYSASSSQGVQGVSDGFWEIELPASRLSRGTYDIRAHVSVGVVESRQSGPLYLGVGGAPNPNLFNRSDLNRDGKVNLVDFSILLSQWNTDDEIADINEDGVVNLSDVSIMLFNWTG